MVIFTFIGKMTKADIAQWNQAVLDLKKKFSLNLVGVTIGGDPTPKNLSCGLQGDARSSDRPEDTNVAPGLR